ncbi:MtrAB system histidine kinase MtrB [Nesterenkonia sandarakina]|uniref:Sensor histidine kinase MtrB n=1 Tax=Nesterenkonia sandarakina TaxID=272918 RepID=A0A2T0YGP6_9MICC|nr:MtrAB system histidine kinase MtrB [Nesterenkonia sandarakina]PRZ14191.1 two-component system sensor histidine kinase MtrB [Nesterenkonia sandarakina]
MIRDRTRDPLEEIEAAAQAESEQPPAPGAKRTFAGTARKVSGLPRLWARSLLIRAVFFTGLLTMISTMAVAAFLVQQVTSGLFQERFDQAELEAADGLDAIRSSFAALSTSNRTEAQQDIQSILNDVDDSTAQIQREVILLPLEGGENLYVDGITSGGLPPSLISDELNDAVAGGTGQYWQAVAYPNNGAEEPGIAFGTQVDVQGNPYALYFVYNFSPVQENVAFVFRTMLVAGVAILLINMAIPAWVARSVVRPVSQAAEVSERIADGQLDQRLAVRGEDEIARLGLSFNRMASNLQEQITQLANLSKMQQRFVSDVSHELRTPLTTVRMAAEVLHESRDDFDPINRRSTELLHHQVERFQALLSDLLEMSRFDAGAAELATAEVDLLDLAREVLISSKPLAESSNTPLGLVVQGENFLAEVDARRISRILRNLINNAIEHAEARPVDVIVSSSPTAIGIAVRDHGIGMSPSEVAHVFDRFWRADPARARTTGGSGLGLSIATEDTRLHQGALDAWGQKGQGSCFRLVLPRRQSVPYRASPMALPPVYRATDRYRIENIQDAFDEQEHDRINEQALYQPKKGES